MIGNSRNNDWEQYQCDRQRLKMASANLTKSVDATKRTEVHIPISYLYKYCYIHISSYIYVSYIIISYPISCRPARYRCHFRGTNAQISAVFWPRSLAATASKSLARIGQWKVRCPKWWCDVVKSLHDFEVDWSGLKWIEAICFFWAMIL